MIKRVQPSVERREMSRTLFADRDQAGRELAERLAAYVSADAVVLALPRGGVPVAVPIARQLAAELDLLMVRKLGVPGHRELAMGAVAAIAGALVVVRNPRVIRLGGVSEEAFEATKTRELQVLADREKRYRQHRPPLNVSKRTVIVVDDGLATGATLRAGVTAVRGQQPKSVVAAVPVGSEEGLAELRPDVDELVCLSCPSPFYAVGQAYRDFGECDDAEVTRLLAQ
jgi:predicted phosphoribosyltransferase